MRFWQEERADEDVCVEDAAQLCALQKGIQRLRCESPSFRLASDLIEYLLQGWEFASSEFSEPKAYDSLYLPLLFWGGGIVRARRLWVQRNGNRDVRHGFNLPPFYGKNSLVATDSAAPSTTAVRT